MEKDFIGEQIAALQQIVDTWVRQNDDVQLKRLQEHRTMLLGRTPDNAGLLGNLRTLLSAELNVIEDGLRKLSPVQESPIPEAVTPPSVPEQSPLIDQAPQPSEPNSAHIEMSSAVIAATLVTRSNLEGEALDLLAVNLQRRNLRAMIESKTRDTKLGA